MDSNTNKKIKAFNKLLAELNMNENLEMKILRFNYLLKNTNIDNMSIISYEFKENHANLILGVSQSIYFNEINVTFIDLSYINCNVSQAFSCLRLADRNEINFLKLQDIELEDNEYCFCFYDEKIDGKTLNVPFLIARDINYAITYENWYYTFEEIYKKWSNVGEM